jgi:hypothetical protein
LGRNLKKFLFRGFCFVSIGLALLFALNALYVRTNGYRSLDDTGKFSVDSSDLDVINLGSSHGQCAFDYSEIEGIDGANLGLTGQNFYFDFEVLKKCGKNLPQGSTVIISVSDFSFDSLMESDNQRTLYYKILDYGSIPNHSLVEYVELGLLPILNAKANIKYLLKDKSSAEHVINPYVLDNNDADLWKSNARDRAKESELKHEVSEEGQKENYQMNIEKLGEIVEYCQERGYKAALVTTPFTKYYNEIVPEEYLNEMHKATSEVCRKYGLSYLDYSHDPRFTERLEYFIDATHLNSLGAKTFTDIVLSDLGII